MKIKIGGKTVEIDNEELSKAIEAEQEEIEVKAEDLSIRSKEEEDTFINNIKKETVKTALEMEVKKYRNELGLEFEGKNMDNLVEALKEKHREEFTKDPNKQLEQMQTDLKTLQERNKSLEGERDTVKTDFDGYKKDRAKLDHITKGLPENLSLPKDDMLLILNNKIKTDIDENGNVVVLDANGQVKKDANLQPIPYEKELENFFATNESYLKEPAGGRGGGDSSGDSDGAKSIDHFNKKMETAGVDVGSYEYNTKLNDAVKNKEIDL
jgi:hypothetical protein